MIRRVLVAAAAVAAAVVGGAAQQPGPPAPVLRASVDQVVVDVVVTDGNGEPVRGLTAADFEISERGKPQPIATFTEVTLPVPAPAPAVPAGAGDVVPRPSTGVGSNRDSAAGRVYLLLLDDVHVALDRTRTVRRGASDFVSRYVQPGDVVAVVHTSGAAPGQEFTADMTRVHASIQAFMGKKGMSPATKNANRQAEQRRDPRGGDLGSPIRLDDIPQGDVFAAKDSLRAIVDAAAVLETVPGRRKAMLYFSEGIPIPFDTPQGQQIVQSLDEVWTAAARANIAVYPLDPRGLNTIVEETMGLLAAPTPEVTAAMERERRVAGDLLRSLAEGTGGTAGVDTNSLARTFARVDADSRHYYLLGYVPGDARRDGRYRSLDVKVKRPGVQVSARKGYTAPNDAPPPRKAVERFADPTLSPELVALLARPVPASGLSFAAAAVALPGAEPNVRVVIEIAPGALPPAASDTTLEIALLGVGPDGKTSRVRKGKATIAASDAEAISAGGLRILDQLTLAPGRQQVRVALRDATRGTSGLVICDVDVPAAGSRGLTMSAPVIGAASASRIPSLNQDERLAGAFEEAPPTTARAFEPGDAIRALVELADGGGAARQVAISTTVRDAQNRAVVTQAASVSLEPGRPGRYVVDVAIDDTLPPGQYVLRFEAHGDPKAEPLVREVAFAVGGAAP
jgi:VWFA-related protein